MKRQCAEPDCTNAPPLGTRWSKCAVHATCACPDGTHTEPPPAPAGPLVMTVRIVGGDPDRVVRELRAAGHRLEFELLGHADVAWSIRTEEPVGECPSLGRCGE